MLVNKQYIENSISRLNDRLKNEFKSDLGKLYMEAFYNNKLGSFLAGNADPVDGIKYSFAIQAEVYALIYNHETGENITGKDIVVNVMNPAIISTLFYFAIDWLTQNYDELDFETIEKLQHLLDIRKNKDAETVY